ncbi:MAG: hypothetical protein M1812_007651 [Candelaria pacifica]|nr:MAG: hypothetical protein M1812_007651 [Candelaria pacifica]
MQMIQQSQIPISVPLKSISPEENYSSDEESSPSSASSADSAPLSSLSDAPTAAARKVQLGKPYEQQQNSSGVDENLAQQRGKTARARPARVEQDEEEEQAEPSISAEEEEQGRAALDMRQSSIGRQVENSVSSDPKGMSTSPSSAQRSPNQVLSPTGYILGFVQPDADSHLPNFPSLSRNPNSVPAAPVSEPQSSEQTAESALGSPPHQDDNGDARSAAVQLLLGFMGALQASQYAVESFVANVVCYYRHTAKNTQQIQVAFAVDLLSSSC